MSSGSFDGAIVFALLIILLLIGISKLRRRVYIPWGTTAIVMVFVFLTLFLWAWSNR